MTAVYRFNGDVRGITDDFYTSKTKFADDLRSNGFRVIEIFNEQEVEQIRHMNPLKLELEMLSKRKYKRIAYEYITS